MTAEQFNQHGWKATDKVNYNGYIYPVILVDFESKEICISVDENDRKVDKWLLPDKIELYQPLHEAHTHLLTNPD